MARKISTCGEISLAIKSHNHVGKLDHRVPFDFRQSDDIVEIINDLMRRLAK